jgi:uncharacterized iron-regulated membrane protein
MSETQYPLIVRPRFVVNARKWWRLCHIYLALSLGLLFALIGLTGSLSIYREELDRLFNPQLRVDAPQAQLLSLDKIIAAVRTANPDRHGAWTLELPRAADGMITAWFEKPKESVDAFYAPLMVSVNPYTGQVVDSRFWGQTLGTWVMDLHTQLLLDGFGRNCVAVLGGLLLLSVISGLYLWWPGWHRLGIAFSVRHDTGLMALLFDLHRLLGFASSGLLLLLAFTGFHLAYPALLENLTAASGMGHGDAGPNVRSTAIPNDRPVSLSEAVLVARGPFPSSEVRRITTPAGELGTYRINLRQRHEINQHHPFTTVWVDRWSGQIRDVQNPSKFSPGQTFTTWLWPLHTGEAFGNGGRALWFFVGSMPALLFASGLLHWLHRHGFIPDREIDLKQSAIRIRSRGIKLVQQISASLKPVLNKAFQILYGRLSRIKRLK